MYKIAPFLKFSDIPSNTSYSASLPLLYHDSMSKYLMLDLHALWRIIFCFLILNIATIIPIHSQDKMDKHELVFDECYHSNSTFSESERLVYRMYYNWQMIWIPAGEVTFQVSADTAHYAFEATGKTYPSYDSFFKVDDHFYSKCDRQSLRSKAFVRDVQEGNYRLFDSITWRQDSYEVEMIHGKSKKQAKTTTEDLGQCMQDMLSMIYKVRNVSLEGVKKNDYINLHMFFDKERFRVRLTMKEFGKNKKIKNLGKFKTNKIDATTIAGYVFEEGTQMSIWFSDDENKLPLQIESPVSIGSVKAVLLSYDNLKYDLTSEIK